MLTAKSSPKEKRAEHARMCRVDVVDWGSKIEWSKTVDIAYPGGAGLGVTSAASALLPSAALGIKCSSAALSKASVTGLERALSVALLWMRADASKEIHSRLIEVAPHPEVSESKAKALCDIAIAKRAKLSEGDAIALHSEMSGALYETLVLERESRHVVKVKVKKASL